MSILQSKSGFRLDAHQNRQKHKIFVVNLDGTKKHHAQERGQKDFVCFGGNVKQMIILKEIKIQKFFSFIINYYAIYYMNVLFV